MNLPYIIILATYWIMTSYAFIPQYNFHYYYGITTKNPLFHLQGVDHQKDQYQEKPTFGNNEEIHVLNQYNQNQQQQQSQETYLWNMTALQMDVDRLIYRSNQKLIKLQAKVASSSPMEHELEIEQQRYNQLLQLRYCLQSYSTMTNVTTTNPTMESLFSLLPMDIIHQIQKLNVTDKPRIIPPRGPGKVKGPRYSSSSRLPYRRYYSLDGTEIRVREKKPRRGNL
jgi:hypothetical protein